MRETTEFAKPEPSEERRNSLTPRMGSSEMGVEEPGSREAGDGSRNATRVGTLVSALTRRSVWK
jgi:hypothetical protein